MKELSAVFGVDGEMKAIKAHGVNSVDMKYMVILCLGSMVENDGMQKTKKFYKEI